MDGESADGLLFVELFFFLNCLCVFFLELCSSYHEKYIILMFKIFERKEVLVVVLARNNKGPK